MKQPAGSVSGALPRRRYGRGAAVEEAASGMRAFSDFLRPSALDPRRSPLDLRTADRGPRTADRGPRLLNSFVLKSNCLLPQNLLKSNPT